MVYKKCPGCGESKVPVARKNCPGCGYNYTKKEAEEEETAEKRADSPKKGRSSPRTEEKASSSPAKEPLGEGDVSPTRDSQVRSTPLRSSVDTKKKEKERSSPSGDDSGEEHSVKNRPKRNVRKPLLLRHEMAVAAAVAAETSSLKSRTWKSTSAKRGARGTLNVRGKRSLPSAGRGRVAPDDPPTTVRTLLSQQRRPRGRPRVCQGGGVGGSGGSSAATIGRSGHKPGLRASHTTPPTKQWSERDDDDDDDYDYGLTLHHKKQISESLDQTKGQRTRELIPRRAANTSVALSSDQLQGSPGDVNDSNLSDSNSPNSSKSASPCPAEDVYNNLPPYRMLQYGIVLGDINRKFLNQSFKPM